MALQLEIGKTYRDRKGREWKVVSKEKHQTAWPFKAERLGKYQYLTSNGKVFVLSLKHDKDLIEEVKD